jgi:hypothetical protein
MEVQAQIISEYKIGEIDAGPSTFVNLVWEGVPLKLPAASFDAALSVLKFLEKNFKHPVSMFLSVAMVETKILKLLEEKEKGD